MPVIQAFPLTWPEGWKRTVPHARTWGKFSKSERRTYTGSESTYMKKLDLSVNDATTRVLQELGRLGVVRRDDIVISTNVRLRLDGLPRSNEPEPSDPGVAVYWEDPLTSAHRCMAIDRYARVADNLAAVAATIDAMRAIERHGGAEILNRAFTGFTALPAPGQSARDWRMVLELNGNATLERAKENYRRLASAAHPDKEGGSHDAMAELNAAWAEAQQVLQ